MSTLDGVLNFVTGSQPRGLHNFISEIRAIDDKALEIQRVDKELGNIRQKFSNSSSLSAYQKKKYVWKLCYIYMLGYDVDFGHVEFISLLSAPNFSEKSVGYMAIGLLLRPDDQLMHLVYNSIRVDLHSHVVHSKTLALGAIANLGGEDMATNLAADVKKVLVDTLEMPLRQHRFSFVDSAKPPDEAEMERSVMAIMKKAALATLRMYRSVPEVIDAAEWVSILGNLLRRDNIGLMTSAMALITGLASHNHFAFEKLVPAVVNILTKLVIDSTCPADYVYYRVPCPWLQARCLRFLQYFKEPEGEQWATLSSVLLRILTRGEAAHDSINVQNTQYSLVFEAIALVVSWGPTDPRGDHYELREMTHRLLGKYIAVNDANVKYLALDMLSRVCKVDGVVDTLKTYQHIVVASLNDADMSVRKRSLEVVFLITDATNAHSVVAELVIALTTADEAMREDMVVKIAILAQRFYENIRWYVDTMVEVIVIAGNFVAEAVWHHIVQTVINNEVVHEYAAQKLFNSVQNKFCQEVCICLAAYLLGEVGFTICDKPGCSGFEQFAALHQHFELATSPSKSILLTCYIKLSNQYPDLAEDVQAVFTKLSTSAILELQQRACEYGALPTQGADIMQAILERMPSWIEKEQSVLQSMVVTREAARDTSDKASWQVSNDEKAASRRASVAASSQPHAAPVRPQAGAKWTPSTGEPPAPAPAANVDLLSMYDDAADSSFAVSSASSALSADEQVQVIKLFHRAGVAGNVKTPLYENANITVNCQADYRGAQGRIAITLYNKGDADVTDIAFEVQSVYESEYIVVKTQPPAGNRISSMDEVKMQVAIACRRPFCDMTSAPTCTVRYKCMGSQRILELRLPVTAMSFCEPVSFGKEDFMGRWKVLDGGAGVQMQETHPISAALGMISDDLMTKLRTNLMPKLKVGHVDGIDGPNSITGSTIFRTTTPGPDGQPLCIDCFLRLEADRASNRVRFTVRCKNQKIVSAMMQVLKGQLC